MANEFDIKPYDLERKASIWEAVNAYVVACGGNPAKGAHGNTAR